ncbi:MAG: ABC transporter permease [DPANN group archaeon]|nr:ABC transporter permease [DPANN group archaeon]
MVIGNIRHKGIRSWLTMIGIIVGIAAVVSLISLGFGMQEAVLSEFQKIGTDRLVITPGSGMTSTPASADMTPSKLTQKDIDVINRVKGVDVVSEVLIMPVLAEFKGDINYVILFGTPVDTETSKYLNTMDFFKIELGRTIDSSDQYKVSIGPVLAYDTFIKDVDVGNVITVNNEDFKVVGIQKKSGSPLHDKMIRMPIDVARELLDEPDMISSIFVKTIAGFDVTKVSNDIEYSLRKSRNVKVGEEDFKISTPTEIIERFLSIFAIIQIVFIGIAAISLIVGGIGVMNTMYTSVLERTRDIGLMKAIGAKNNDIMMIFLIESGVLGLVGGTVGVLIGVGISKSVELIAVYVMGPGYISAYLSFELLFGALIFSFVVGCVSGVIPARQAAGLNPVDALRYE